MCCLVLVPVSFGSCCLMISRKRMRMGGISPSEQVRTTTLDDGIEYNSVDKRLRSGISGEIYFIWNTEMISCLAKEDGRKD